MNPQPSFGDRFVDLWDRLLALPFSRRFQVALIGLLAVVLQDTLGLTDDQTQWVVGLLAAWIVGDGLRKTGGSSDSAFG